MEIGSLDVRTEHVQAGTSEMLWVYRQDSPEEKAQYGEHHIGRNEDEDILVGDIEFVSVNGGGLKKVRRDGNLSGMMGCKDSSFEVLDCYPEDGGDEVLFRILKVDCEEARVLERKPERDTGVQDPLRNPQFDRDGFR